ncbi:hypothetical protein [Tellurirhabdus bombi]|uniref:hypothetical protein n=1 Tax=Tellurirhabdus bombi TaxID=2907205 RepID=UPI001F2B6023|nr:hypothetical protein [Tellurirhabdus bombi]
MAFLCIFAGMETPYSFLQEALLGGQRVVGKAYQVLTLEVTELYPLKIFSHLSGGASLLASMNVPDNPDESVNYDVTLAKGTKQTQLLQVPGREFLEFLKSGKVLN